MFSKIAGLACSIVIWIYVYEDWVYRMLVAKEYLVYLWKSKTPLRDLYFNSGRLKLEFMYFVGWYNFIYRTSHRLKLVRSVVFQCPVIFQSLSFTCSK